MKWKTQLGDLPVRQQMGNQWWRLTRLETCILQNKKTQKGTKRDAPDKITVGTKAPHKKKGKNTPILDEDAPLPEDDDANNFEPTLRTEEKKKSLLKGKS